MPALATRTSTGPCASSTRVNALSTWAGSVTSHGTARIPAGGSPLRWVTATVSPASRNASATARPMPRLPPVTSTERAIGASSPIRRSAAGGTSGQRNGHGAGRGQPAGSARACGTPERAADELGDVNKQQPEATMTAQTTLEAPVQDDMETQVGGRVHCVHLADGKLVRLSGTLGEAELSRLRLALLAPLAEDCHDVVVDAGEVEVVDDEAVAILLAARDWAEECGARMLLSRCGPALEKVLAELDMTDALPRLGAPRRDAIRPTLTPGPRNAN